jgi:hypothetical protein
MNPHIFQNSNPSGFDSNCEVCGGKQRDAVHIDRCCSYWNAMGWQDKERFLLRHGFKMGWSSHTWKHLDRPIQAAFELHCGVLFNGVTT